VALAFLPPPGRSRVWWPFFTFTQNVGVAFKSGTGVLTVYWSLAV
jgi:hypothetical protein